MTTTNWIELPKLVEYLYCSERTVYKLKKANVFVAGEHFYRIGEGKEKGNGEGEIGGARSKDNKCNAGSSHICRGA